MPGLWLLLAATRLCSYLLLLLLLLYSAFRLYKYWRGFKRGCVSIPGPPALPVLGHCLSFYRHRRATLPLFERWVARYGHTLRFTVLGDRDIILINDPESIKHVLSTRFRLGVYGKGAYQRAQYADLIGEGIFNANGEEWKEARRCAGRLFTQESLRQHVGVFQKHAVILAEQLYALATAGSDSRAATVEQPRSAARSGSSRSTGHSDLSASATVDMQDYFLRFTMDSFSEIGLGFEMNSLRDPPTRPRARAGAEAASAAASLSTAASASSAATQLSPGADFSRAFDYVQSECFRRMEYGVFWPWLRPPSPRFKAALHSMDQLVYTCIRAAQSKTRQQLLESQTLHPDLLGQTLLGMLDASGERNASYSDRVLRDTTMNFLIAGRDTTALLLSWFYFQLSSHPAIEARIVAELEEVLGPLPAGAAAAAPASSSSSHAPHLLLQEELDYDQLRRLVFLQACLQESLRLYPSVPFNGFTALADDVLPGGFFVPRGTYVTYSAYLLHRRADLYPNPELFDPDRWMPGGSNYPNPRPFEFLAFHGGPRECPGREMAFLEAKVAVATLMRRRVGREGGKVLRIRLAPHTSVEVKRAIILTARGGMHMRVDLVDPPPAASAAAPGGEQQRGMYGTGLSHRSAAHGGHTRSESGSSYSQTSASASGSAEDGSSAPSTPTPTPPLGLQRHHYSHSPSPPPEDAPPFASSFAIEAQRQARIDEANAAAEQDRLMELAAAQHANAVSIER